MSFAFRIYTKSTLLFEKKNKCSKLDGVSSWFGCSWKRLELSVEIWKELTQIEINKNILFKSVLLCWMVHVLLRLCCKVFSPLSCVFTGQPSLDEEDIEIWRQSDPTAVEVPSTYTGPHIKFPLTSNQVEALITAFKMKQVGNRYHI